MPDRYEDRARPPLNRLPEALPVLHLEVEHAGGKTVLDPNGMVMACFAPDWAATFPPIGNAVSDLSGEAGAVVYRAEGFEVRLTPDEFRRLQLRALTPSEALAMLDRFGAAFDWHEDFYDYDTGEAMQPKTDVPEDRPVPRMARH